MNLDEILKYNKIAIVGPVGSGKTTLSGQIKDRQIVHTDDYVDSKISWAEQPLFVKRNCDDMKRFAVEGMIVPRALRKGLSVDAIVVLGTPRKALSKPQEVFSKQCMTILNDWIKENKNVVVINWND